MSASVLAHGFVLYLAEPAARALAVGCLAALALPVFRITRSRWRLAVWTMVLYVALAMPLLGLALPRLSVAVPPLAVPGPSWLAASPDVEPPATVPETSADEDFVVAASPHGVASATAAGDRDSTALAGATAAGVDAANIANMVSADEPAAMSLARRAELISWPAVGLAVYLLIGLMLVARLLVGMRLSGNLDRASPPVRDDRALGVLQECVRAAGLRRAPRLQESRRLSVPATFGVRRPVILLPSDWRAWDEADLRAILAHEVAHVARRDALTQQLSLLHRAIFWFSPLAWWLDRQVTELAEQASDEAALAGGADSARYAETLLGFFAELHAAPGRIWWQGVSMAKAGRAERRVDRILAWSGGVGMRKSCLVALAVIGLPLVFVFASVDPVVAHAQSAAALPAVPAPTAAVASTPRAAVDAPPPPAAPPTPTSPPSPPAAPTTPGVTPPAAPPAPAVPPDATMSGRLFADAGGPRFVIVTSMTSMTGMTGMTGDRRGVTMSGNREDLAHARALRSRISGDFIWFEHDEQSFIITDPATVARAQQLFAPQEELGRKQEELGRQQEALGRQQAALGHRMERVRVKLPDMSAAIARIQHKLDAMASAGASQRELGRLQSEIGRLQSRLGSYQSDAGSAQGAIGRQQGDLGRRQGRLGHQQGALGREQARLAKIARANLRSLFQQAMANGTAKPESER